MKKRVKELIVVEGKHDVDKLRQVVDCDVICTNGLSISQQQLDIIKQAFSAAFIAIKPLFGGFETLSGGILGVTGRIGESVTAFDEFINHWSGNYDEYLSIFFETL